VRKNDLFKFRQRIRDVREARKLTQREFAAFLGIGPGRLGNWESAEKGTVPSMKTIEMVAAKLGCSVAWLIGGLPAGIETVDFPKNPARFPHDAESETHSAKEAGAGELYQLLRRAEIIEGDMRLLRSGLARLVDDQSVSLKQAESAADAMLGEDIEHARKLARPGSAAAAPAPHTRAGLGGGSAHEAAPGKPTHNRGDDKTT
jgi:transcriptional regulator with XRE-family HTH domain